jgi:MFS family permease
VASAYVSSLGDGAFLAAMPLAAAAITRDPTAVAVVAAAEYVPWLIVTPVAGALVDRWSRRLVLIFADALRAIALTTLVLLIVLDLSTIPALALVACVVVVGQIFADTAAQSIVVELAGRHPDALHRANGHISSANTTGKSLIGPPAGSALFAAAPWLPFAIDALSFAGSAGLVSTLPADRAVQSESRRPRLLTSIGEGAAFVWRHPTLRTLCLLVAAANAANFMVLSTLVLYATSALGVSTAGYGLLLAAGAIGGILGSLTAARVARLLGDRGAITASLVIGVFAWPALAITTSPFAAGAILGGVEFSAAVVTVVAITARQRLTPPELLGRVISAFRTIGAGAAPLGALIGGLLASGELTTPMYAASGVLLVAVALSVLGPRYGRAA